jgi:Xaa-Pro aminopeptidase
MTSEIAVKRQRLVGFMSKNDLGSLVLTSRANFSWLTGGKLNCVADAVQQGVASLVVTPDKIACLTNNIERPRIQEEELAQAGIDLVGHPWYDPAAGRKATRKLLSRGKVGFDILVPGLPKRAVPLGLELSQLRWNLLPEEIERYKIAGKAASDAMETTIRQIRPGMTEYQIAALAAKSVRDRSSRPWVILVAVDDRIKKYRHPIPTNEQLQRIAMVVLCVERFGLVCSLTRFVSFDRIDADLRRRHDAVVTVDATVNLASQPGKTLGQMFDVIKKSYADAGFSNEWQLHHQGGPAGYQPRDCVATPDDPTALVKNQALAWNPSITGTKSEDTIIITNSEPIVVTAAGTDWPMIRAEYDGKSMPRPDILVMA